MSEELFVRLVTADLPDAPPYFTYDAILNTRERATLDKNLEEVLHPVEFDEVIRPGDAGAQILDVGCHDRRGEVWLTRLRTGFPHWVAFLTGVQPARRAARVLPMDVLREE